MKQEIHLTQWNNGHIPSADCFCEPIPRILDLNTTVFQHEDYVPYHRSQVLAVRKTNPDWITQLLTTL